MHEIRFCIQRDVNVCLQLKKLTIFCVFITLLLFVMLKHNVEAFV